MEGTRQKVRCISAHDEKDDDGDDGVVDRGMACIVLEGKKDGRQE